MDRETGGVRALFPPPAREESPKVFIRNTDAPGAVDLAGLGWGRGSCVYSWAGLCCEHWARWGQAMGSPGNGVRA